MSCIVLKNGVESALHRQLIDLFGQEIADKKMSVFLSDDFKKKFGDFQALQEVQSDLIPAVFSGRLNETYEPKLTKDDVGYYYLDAQYTKQYIDVVESKLYDTFKSERAINTLVDILASNHLEETGFKLDFDSLELGSAESSVLLETSIRNKMMSLAMELMRSDNMAFRINGGSLMVALNNKEALDELSYKVKELFKARRFEYKEDGPVGEEEIHNEAGLQRDQIVSKSSVEINPKSRIGALVKLRLSLIKNPKDIDPDFGQAKSIDFNVLYNKLTNILKDSPILIKDGKVVDAFKVLIGKIGAHANNVKYASNLVAYLEKLDVLKPPKNSKEAIRLNQLKAGIIRTFNLQKNKFATKTIVAKEVDVIPAIKETITLPNGAKTSKTVKAAVKGNEYTYDTKDAVFLSNGRKEVVTEWGLSFKEYFKFPEKAEDEVNEAKREELNSVILKIDKLVETKNVTNFEKALNLNKMLNKIGIEISDETLYRALNQNKDKAVSDVALEENSLGFIKNTKDALSNSFRNHNSKKPIFGYYWYNQLADAKIFYSDNGSESSILTAGKNKYLFSNPTYINNKINTWKQDPTLLQKEYDSLGVWEQGSNLYKYLLALEELTESERVRISSDRIANLNVETFNSYRDMSERNSRQKDVKELSKNEDIKDTVNGLLYSKTKEGEFTHGRGTTAPGKSTQLEIVHGLYIESGTFLKDEKTIVAKSDTEVMFNYLFSEFQRMEEAYDFIADDKNKNKLNVYYHTKSNKSVKDENGKIIKGNLGNALKSQLFPSLSFDKINSRKLDLLEDIYDENGRVILDNVLKEKDKLKNHIHSAIVEEVKKLKQDLINANIIEVAGKGLYNNKGIDTRAVEAYNTGKQITEKGLTRILGNLFLNGTINQIEYSKLFSGDVAYYKNEVDYIKRIGSNLSDGIYQYLDEGTKDFNIGVIEPVEYVEPYLNELKEVIQGDSKLLKAWEESVNAADGQAWISVNRWKTLLEGIGNFTEKHQSVYEKLIGKNDEAISPDELKLVAQPMKGVYFFRDEKGKPIYLKYSQAVIIPQLASNPGFRDMLALMKYNNLDELVTFDAIKVGSLTPTKIHNEDGTTSVRNEDGTIKDMNVMTLDSRGWKLQQDLPTKTFKETDTGSQLLNNMLVLMSDKLDSKQAEFEYNGKEYSALDYAKLLDNTLGEYIELNYKSFMSEFSIDPVDGIIHGVDKFYNMLADELASREYSDEIVKAIRAKLSIAAMPAFEGKLQSIFSAIVKDRVNKIKTNGGAFIQMSPYGFSKEELDHKHPGVKWSPNVGQVFTEGEWKWEKGHHVKPYHFKLNEDGTRAKSIFGRDIIVPEQVLISGSFLAKYVPDYETKSSKELFGTRNPETGKLEGGLIDNRILENIIGYRIPNQGPSSNGALEVVGILPPGMGDVLVAFTGITKKTGGDYDIDKLYVMFPNYNAKYRSRADIVKQAEAFIKKNGITKKIMKEEFAADDIPISDRIDSQTLTANYISQILLESDNSYYAEGFRSQVSEKEVIGLEYVDAEDKSKKGIQNKIIELYKGLILHKDNVKKVMTPLDHPYIKEDAQNLAPEAPKRDLATFSFIQDVETKYSFLDGLLGVGMEANAASEYGRGSMAGVYYEGVAIGKRGNEGRTIPMTIIVEGKEKVIEKVHTKFDKVDSVELSPTELEEYVTSYNKRAPADQQMDWNKVKAYKSLPISDSISALMNAFVDIAKDPYITNINWNAMTTNTGNMLIRAGVHPFVVLSFLAQPVISEYINFTKTYEIKDAKSQVTNTKDAFRVHKVGDLIKGEAIILLNSYKDSMIQINKKVLYESVAATVTGDLDYLNSKDFTTDKVLISLMKKQGIEYSQLNADQKEELKKNILEAAKPIVEKHRIFFKRDFKDENDVINTNLFNLRENVFKDNLSFQADTFNTFLKYMNYSKKLKASMEASGYDVNGYGKNTTSLLMAKNRINSVRDKGVLNYKSKISYLDGTLKLLGHREKYTIDNSMKIVQANPTMFPSAAPYVWNTFNRISMDIHGENLQNEDLAKLLDESFKTYLMSGFTPFNMSNEKRGNLLENFPDEFIKFKSNKENLDRFYVLQELHIKETPTRKYIGLNNKSNSKEYTDKMINSWREMMKYHPEFAEKLIKYSFVTSGFNNSTISFFQYIPPTFFFQNDFNGYIDDFTKKFDKASFDENFSDHFFMSNLDNNKVVRQVSEFSMTKEQPYGSIARVFKNHVNGKYIKVVLKDEEGSSFSTFYKSIGIDVDNNNIYTRYIPTKGGYSLIQPLIKEDRNGASTYIYNVDEITLPKHSDLTKESIESLDTLYSSVTRTQTTSTSVDEFNQEDEIVKEDDQLNTDDMDKTLTKYPEFTKLPNKSNTPTMTYAGVGSRQTPKNIMEEMTKLAKELESKGYTLRSGHAEGADLAFEEGVVHKKEIFPGTKTTGTREHTIAREIHPAPYALDKTKNPSFVWNLMARNTNQIFGKDLDVPVDFVIAWTPDALEDYKERSIESGGTGQAIEMASRKGIPVINMANPDWRNKLNEALNVKKEIIKSELKTSAQLSLFEDATKSKAFSDLVELLENGGHKVLEESGIKSIEDLSNKSEDELGELIKKICKRG